MAEPLDPNFPEEWTWNRKTIKGWICTLRFMMEDCLVPEGAETETVVLRNSQDYCSAAAISAIQAWADEAILRWPGFNDTELEERCKARVAAPPSSSTSSSSSSSSTSGPAEQVHHVTPSLLELDDTLLVQPVEPWERAWLEQYCGLSDQETFTEASTSTSTSNNNNNQKELKETKMDDAKMEEEDGKDGKRNRSVPFTVLLRYAEHLGVHRILDLVCWHYAVTVLQEIPNADQISKVLRQFFPEDEANNEWSPEQLQQLDALDQQAIKTQLLSLIVHLRQPPSPSALPLSSFSSLSGISSAVPPSETLSGKKRSRRFSPSPSPASPVD
jgi:hypothetical protein